MMTSTRFTSVPWGGAGRVGMSTQVAGNVLEPIRLLMIKIMMVVNVGIEIGLSEFNHDLTQ